MQLTYVHVVSLEETHFVETYSAESLQEYFSAQCEAFLAWAEQEDGHRETRDQWAVNWLFPFQNFAQANESLPTRCILPAETVTLASASDYRHWENAGHPFPAG